MAKSENERHSIVGQPALAEVRPVEREVTQPGMTEFAKQVYGAPDLKDLGRRFHEPHERKDGGAIDYTTVAETVQTWAEDPYGEQTFAFLSYAYGIPTDRMREIFQENSAEGYIQAKDEGRMVGMVGAQILKPTFYYMANTLMLGELQRQGVPTALMVMTYPEDVFYKGNNDKKSAFDPVEFPVGTTIDRDGQSRVQTVSIELKPYAIKEDDGTVRRITTIDEANGYRCEQILVQAVDARGPEDQPLTQVEQIAEPIQPGVDTPVKKSSQRISKATTHYQAAIGLDFPGLVNTRIKEGNKERVEGEPVADSISLTDFYQALWEETIAQLRRSGELPSEEDMPIFFVDAKRLYTAIGKEAKPSREMLEALGFTSRERILRDVLKVYAEEADEVMAGGDAAADAYLAERNLKVAESGLLVHMNDMLDPISYYVGHAALPDLYLECSSCGGEEFVGKLDYAQQVRQAHHVPEKEVRLPDVEIPEMEAFCIHPTGDFNPQGVETPDMLAIGEQLRAYEQQVAQGVMNKAELKRAAGPLYDQLSRLRREATAAYYRRVQQFDPTDYAHAGLVIPEPVAATYKELLHGVSDAVQSDKVQRAIKHVTAQN